MNVPEVRQPGIVPGLQAEAGTLATGATPVEELCQLVTCNVGREEFAIDILCVQEINRLAEITRVPKSPEFVEGVINLRGRIIPVINLRRRFGMPDAEPTIQTRVVVVNVDGRMIGLIVDAVSEVMQIGRGAIEPPPAMGDAPGAEFVQGIGRLNDRLLIVLDLHRLLALHGQKTSEGG